MPKIFVTKNFRKKGIQETSGKIEGKVAKTDLGLFHKPDWFLDEAEAKAQVEHLIMQEVKHLEKTIKQLLEIYEAL